MKKRTLIGWSIALGVFIVLAIIIATVFSLTTVEFHRTTMAGSANSDSRLFSSSATEAQVEEQLYSSAKFTKGCNLLFVRFDNNVDNMEKANPYVKIDKVVRRFPNKVDVYYSEREAVACIADSGVENAYYVVDCDLKVLDYISFDQNQQKVVENGTYNLPILTYFGCTFSGYEKGDFIENSSLKTYLTNFVTGAFSVNNNVSTLYEDLMGSVFKVQSISFYVTESHDLRCEFTLLADNYDAESQTGVITYDLYSINTTQTGKTYLDKVKTAFGSFVEERVDPNPTNKTFNVYVNTEGKVVAVG